MRCSFKCFVQDHKANLSYLYHTLLPDHVRDRISLNDWIRFAFKNTSEHV